VRIIFSAIGSTRSLSLTMRRAKEPLRDEHQMRRRGPPQVMSLAKAPPIGRIARANRQGPGGTAS
jgi:hypothetical protein